MPTKERRRERRIPYIGPIRLAWEDAHSETRYAQGKCIDVSETGLRVRVDVTVAIPLRTQVSMYAEQINFACAACVKHVDRRGSKYVLGLELRYRLQENVLAAIRESVCTP